MFFAGFLSNMIHGEYEVALSSLLALLLMLTLGICESLQEQITSLKEQVQELVSTKEQIKE
ncbi:hypothetical protein CSB09_00530 [Candidatus Gracilibacteria bacterium]|nr:MAG: hypothetical protein CSB09_00530 [Candidatus Gracilibacteria bacterium]